MPHFQTKKLPNIELPFTKDSYHFLYQTKEINSKSLLMVEYKDKKFFIEIIKREDNYLIRAEKLTRFSPLFIIQNALKIFSSYLDLTLTYSNLDSKKNNMHLLTESKYLKKIDYFVDEFKVPKNLALEIGFGSGRHLLHQAKNNPQNTYIGIEIHKPSIEQVIKQCKLQNIENILILDYDARIFLELLPSLSLSKIFVHFPVPWDKKPDRRVISPIFIDECNRTLKKDGRLELRTDSENYYNYSWSVINEYNQFDIAIKKNHQLEISSKYEDRWIKQEKNIYDFHMINSIPNMQNLAKFKIEFETDLYEYLSNFSLNFKKTLLRDKECFVNIESLYMIDDKNGILKISLGSYKKSQHKYIVFKDKIVQYFPNKLIPIKNSFDAHMLLINHIKEVGYVK